MTDQYTIDDLNRELTRLRYELAQQRRRGWKYAPKASSAGGTLSYAQAISESGQQSDWRDIGSSGLFYFDLGAVDASPDWTWDNSAMTLTTEQTGAFQVNFSGVVQSPTPAIAGSQIVGINPTPGAIGADTRTVVIGHPSGLPGSVSLPFATSLIWTKKSGDLKTLSFGVRSGAGTTAATAPTHSGLNLTIHRIALENDYVWDQSLPPAPPVTPP